MRRAHLSSLSRHGFLASLALAAGLFAVLVGSAAAAPAGRGYELVSTGHQGFPTGAGPVPVAPNPAVWIEPSGGQITFPSVDPFTGDSGQPGTFDGIRGGGAWHNTGWFPSMVDAGNFAAPVNAWGRSDDGSRLFLQTAAAILPSDTNGVDDVYMLNRQDNSVTLISEGSTTPAYYVGRSSDGTRVFFQTATNLVPQALGTATKLYQWVNGVVSLVGIKPGDVVDPGGSVLGIREPGGSSSTLPLNALSPDGGSVIFTSPAPSEASGDNPRRVYLREGGTTIEVSASQCARVDCNAPQQVFYVGASRDRSRIFMTTTQQLTDDDVDTRHDLYVYSAESGELTRLSAGIGMPNPGGIASTLLASSNDGQRIYFRSSAGIALWDHGTTTIIGRAGNSVGAGYESCAQTGNGAAPPEATSDGSVFVFNTETFTPDNPDHPSGPGLYRYEVATRSLIKIAPSGTLPNSILGGYPECHLRRGLTADGRSVFFYTADTLLPEDVNGTEDVYEWRDGSVSLISSGRSDQESKLLGVTPDGVDVYFTTADALSWQDQDTVQDVYDARLGGGFAPPVPPPDCIGDGCRSSLDVPPALPRAGSASLEGSGNVPAEALPSLRVGATGRALTKRLAARGKLRLIARVGKPGRISIRAVARVPRAGQRAGGKQRVVARGSRPVARGRNVVTLQISKAARRALARGQMLRVRVVVRYSESPRTSRLNLTLAK